nr:hypothetical protein [Kineococcus xinjiangensis]
MLVVGERRRAQDEQVDAASGVGFPARPGAEDGDELGRGRPLLDARTQPLFD